MGQKLDEISPSPVDVAENSLGNAKMGSEIVGFSANRRFFLAG